MFSSLTVLELLYANDNKVWINPLNKKDVPVVAVDQKEAEVKISSSVVVADARPVLIARYLKKWNSPLLPYSEMIFDLSEQYEIDWKLILAIGQQESNLCKKIPDGSHNCWGYGIHSKSNLGFDSYELALKSYVAYLKRVYYDNGITTVDEIERKYNPTSYFGEKKWSNGVNFFMRQIEKGNY